MKFVLLPLVVAALIGAGCGCDEDDEEDESPSTQVTTETASSNPTSETVELRDPVEDAFTVQLPKGWNNQAYSARAYDIHRPVSISVSPNGETLIFRGDPSMPNYFTPEGSNPVTYQVAKVNPLTKVEPYRPASEFVPDYARRKFGKLADFSLGEYRQDPETEQKMVSAFANAGMQIEASCGRQYFTYTDKGKNVNAVIFVGIANNGSLFSVDVGGISTVGNPDDFVAMYDAIKASEKMNPAWQQKQQELHEQRMAQIRQATEAMTAQHNRNMAWIQNSAARHQERMKALWAQSDASMDNYWKRSAASDLSHQRFLNETYFLNKNTGTYVGGQAHWDTENLRSMGLNPSDYEQVQIRP